MRINTIIIFDKRMSIQLNSQICTEKRRLVFHKIHFSVKKHVRCGQAVYVCGSIQELGCWNPEKAFKLKWSEDDIWTASLLLSNSLPNFCEYKYIVSDWEHVSPRTATWEVGDHNRKLDIDINKTLTCCDDRWNMDRISLNVAIPKSKGSEEEKYYVTGEINELGTWKERRMMKKMKKSISFQHRKENIYQNMLEDKEISIFTYSFYIYRARQEFSYSYIKGGDVYQNQRTPKRVLNLLDSNDVLPNRINIFHPRGEIFVLDRCKISQLHCSQITKNIYVGGYIKSRIDLQNLKELNITSILSIQSEKDFKKNGLSPHYLKLLCDQFGIKYRRYMIEDMNQQEFVIKAEGGIKIMDEMLNDGGSIYVHCSAGIYRSPQIISLYLTMYQRYTVEEAVNFVKSRHPYAKPSWKVVDASLRLIKLKKYLKKISI